MKRLFTAVFVCLMSALAHAGTVTITANLRDLTGALVTNRSNVAVTLRGCSSNIPRITGTGVVVPPVREFTPNTVTGVVTMVLQSNADISCGVTTGNTYYTVEFKRDGTTLYRGDYQFNAPADLSSAVPINTIPVPNPPLPVYILKNPVFTQQVIQPVGTAFQILGDLIIGDPAGTAAGDIALTDALGNTTIELDGATGNITGNIAHVSLADEATLADRSATRDKGFVNAKTDCAVTGDGVAYDDIAGCATANLTKKIFLSKLRPTACSAGSGGGCIGTIDYRISAPIILGDGQTLECETFAGWPNGGVKIKVDAGIPGVILKGANSSVIGCIFDQEKYWSFTVRNEFPNYGTDLGGSGEDGVIVLGNGSIVKQTAAYGFGRHGFFVGGDAAVTPVWGLGGQPDGYFLDGVQAYSNRGWGIYVEGQDGNAGTIINPKTTGNLLGGVFNNSWFGGVVIGHMSHLDNRAALTAGTDGNISSIQRTSNVTTYAGTAVPSAALNTFVTCSGTTNFNRTMYVTGFTSTSNFSMADAGANVGPDVAGICHASSTTEIYALYKSRGGDLAKLGCGAGADGSSDQIWIYTYCESNSNAPMYGTQSLVLAPHVGTLPAHNAYSGSWMQSISSSFLLTAPQGLQLWNPTNGGNGFLTIRSGSTGGSTGSRGIRFIQHDNTTTDFRLFVLTTGQIGVDCGTLGGGLTITKTQYAILNPCTMTQDVRIGYNNGAWTGKLQVYSDTTKTHEIDPATGNDTLITANGAQWVQGQLSESITLSTSSATTDSVANLLPANSIIESVVARVTTTITTATDWKLGDATTSGRFSAVNSSMTAGTTQVGLVHIDQSGTAGPRQTSAAKLRITTTGTPGAGVVRVTVFYRQFVPPTS